MAQNRVSANRKVGVPMLRAIHSVNRPKRSRLSKRGTKLLRRPLGESSRFSSRLMRAMCRPPCGSYRDGCCRSVAVRRLRTALMVGTSPVIGEKVIEDVVNGHHPDQTVGFINDGNGHEVVAGQSS